MKILKHLYANMFGAGSEEVTPSEKYLLFKHEAVSLDTQTYLKSQFCSMSIILMLWKPRPKRLTNQTE